MATWVVIEYDEVEVTSTADQHSPVFVPGPHRSAEVVEAADEYETVCDGCGKVAEGEDPEGWAGFSSGHNDWGNDSSESFEHHDVCSFRCYVAVVRERLEHWPGYPTLEIDDKDLAFMEGLVAAFESLSETSVPESPSGVDATMPRE